MTPRLVCLSAAGGANRPIATSLPFPSLSLNEGPPKPLFWSAVSVSPSAAGGVDQNRPGGGGGRWPVGRVWALLPSPGLCTRNAPMVIRRDRQPFSLSQTRPMAWPAEQTTCQGHQQPNTRHASGKTIGGFGKPSLPNHPPPKERGGGGQHSIVLVQCSSRAVLTAKLNCRWRGTNRCSGVNRSS